MKIRFTSTLTPVHTDERLSDDRAVYRGTIKVNPKLFGADLVDLYNVDEWVMARYGEDGDCFTYDAETLGEMDNKRCKIIHKALTETPEWNVETIKERLLISDKWVTEGVIRIFEYQTASEQDSHQTSEDNGVGFNGVDAELLTSYAKFAIKSGFLTKGQMTYARKKMLKYSGQLAKIANSKIITEQMKAA
jgi:hypothetical protein